MTQTAGERGRWESAALRGLERADIVVMQATAGPAAGPSVEEVRQATQGEVIVLPEIVLDGIASLERDGPGETGAILGADEFLRATRGLDRAEGLRRFLAGEIDMRQTARLAASIARLRRLEQAVCDLRVTDAIEEMLRERPVVYGCAAPTQDLLFRLFERLCDYLGVEPDAGMPWDPAFHGSLALPRGARAFTPWDVRALGLGYPPDTHWYSQAVTLAQRVWRMAEEARGGSRTPEALSA